MLQYMHIRVQEDACVMFEWIAGGLLITAAALCLWLLVTGLIDMQRINAGDSDVIETQGVVRQVHRKGVNVLAVVTLNVDDEVVRVDCPMHCPLLAFSRPRVTDMVPVLWRRGESSAVAVSTIRKGQRRFLTGFIGLAAAVILWAMVF